MTKPMPVVSIALCVYNGEKYLARQLDTLLNQTYKNLEIIIIDDGSSDGSLKIIENYKKDSRVKLFVNEHNIGLVKNFQKAINHCSGDFIALADQDDIWNLNKVSVMLENIGEAVLIYHDSEFIDENENSLGKMSDTLNMYAGDSSIPFLFYNCISGHSCLFKKSIVLKFGTFDSRFHHDWWIAFVAGNLGVIKYCDNILVKYRQHELSSTDILNRKLETVSLNVKPDPIEVLWLKKCENFNGKDHQLIKNINSFRENQSIFNRIKLVYSVIFNYKMLLFIKRKGNFSKLNFLRKILYNYSR